MPSLKTLEEFKSSFDKIGNEEAVLLAQNLPFDDLPLPDNEPIAPASEASEDTPAAVDTLDDILSASPDTPLDDIFPDLPPDTSPDISADASPDISQDIPFDLSQDDADDGFIDFGGLRDFLSTSTTEPPPPVTEPSGEADDLGLTPDTLPDDFAEQPAGGGDSTSPPGSQDTDDDFSVPAGLLDDFDTDSLGGDGLPESGTAGTDDLGLSDDNFNLDISDTPDFSTDVPDEESAQGSPESGEPFDFADFANSMGSGETPDSSDSSQAPEPFDLGDLPDLGDSPAQGPDEQAGAQDPEIQELTSEDFPADEPLTEDFPTEDFSVPTESTDEDSFDIPETSIPDEPLDLSDFADFADTSETPQTADSGEAFDMPDISESAPASEPAATDDDGFDLGDFPEVEVPDIDVGTNDSFDAFNLENDGLDKDVKLEDDESLGGPDDSEKLDEFAIPGIDDVFAGTSGTLRPDDPDEIALTDEDVSTLMETLTSYPLNLRIACQEIIVEQAVAPDLMSKFIKLLTTGAPPRETAALAGKILSKTISIPKGFEKKTGEELEEEQASFPYIFVHNFLPVLRTVMGIALVALSLGYLIWTFVYLPLRADSIYKRGYDQIGVGAYGRARDLFDEAFAIHEKKIWFYRYAEAFRDERQYLFAEEKYDELLIYTALKSKRGIPEKQAILDYAALETYYMGNYAKADYLLRHYILDFSIWDKDALLAVGDNSMAWGDIDSDHYEDAREAYAVYMERYGRTDPLLERMLRYFIRTDNLFETIQLQYYFMGSTKRKIEASTLAELGGYLLDKRTEEIRGVPNEYIDRIGGIRDILLRAIRADPVYPESYYHLARYYNYYENINDEEASLERAILAFDAARTETPKRLDYQIDALRRYAEIHIERREFFRGEEFLIRGVQLYEEGMSRRVIQASPEHGRLYAELGDLEYFVKDGNMPAALDYYHRAELNGYAPPEIQYRMGASYYQMRQWAEALDRFAAASFPMPYNRKILYALGNVSYLRGNYFAAQGYYDRLLELLEADRTRIGTISPTENEEQLELAERLMVVQNNLAITLEALALRTGDNSYRSTALGLYSESERAWDILTRNPDNMVRLRPSPDIIAPGVNPAYINVQNTLYPVPGYEPLFFNRIDKDVLEPSVWEELAPIGYNLSEGISSGR